MEEVVVITIRDNANPIINHLRLLQRLVGNLDTSILVKGMTGIDPHFTREFRSVDESIILHVDVDILCIPKIIVRCLKLISRRHFLGNAPFTEHSQLFTTHYASQITPTDTVVTTSSNHLDGWEAVLLPPFPVQESGFGSQTEDARSVAAEWDVGTLVEHPQERNSTLAH